jgi:hypothetical protein
MLLLCSSAHGLRLGESAPVTVTFYASPGMDCEDHMGMCGYGNDVNGPNNFLGTSLYPLHLASGNFDFLGGSGACGILSYNGKSRSYVVSDITDPIDSLDRGGANWPPLGSHADLCCHEFDYFQSLNKGGGVDCNNGGICTGNWTRVPCETLGSPDYPDGPSGQYAVRTQAYNQWAKAIVMSRMHGVGEIKHIDFMTRSGGHYSGQRIQGWGAWWTPGQDLSGQGGVGLKVTLADDSVVLLDNYPLPDFSMWNTGNLYMLGP